MIAANVFLIFLFVETAVCLCKEGGRWCLTNGQCCSGDCSWTLSCKPRIECASLNKPCINEHDCCSSYCLYNEAGQAGTCTTGTELLLTATETRLEDLRTEKLLENKYTIEDEYEPQMQREIDMRRDYGLKAQDRNENSELQEQFEHLQQLTAEPKITENTRALPDKSITIKSKPLSHPESFHTETIPKSPFDNAIDIDIDTTSFENFLSTLQNISDSVEA